MKIPEGVVNLMRDRNIAFIATIGRDGYPHVTPVWIDVDDDCHILVNTATSRVKYMNLKRDPRVTISLVDRNDPYNAAMIKGRVVDEVKGREAEEHIDRMAKKYLGLDRFPFRAEGEERVLLKIVAEKVISVP
ncbi:MAG: PPOX class F420-dependent oxidoreductase [Candidatus Nitrosocaldus sp.]|nr:PPOX class F420-dependent oxidoreductase [Candidatus Nitrosocaldus sp.]MCS7141067.1 PPOX class F420-dependent oxidoreductase [Candidatus Nitrosocaldus sp.]MDW8000031.1 PPOX class F420-dependent oxidoreductase [Candidatus Nitrosocaldus sp.]MDW8275940.1 PPOX class F420-dependent oxidoreductase [Candidatus Nitrosocaldus sp.]